MTIDSSVVGVTPRAKDPRAQTRPTPRLRRLDRQLIRTAVFYLPAAYLIAVVVVVFGGPHVWTVSPVATDALNILAAPTSSHPLGTDSLGRDVASRLIHGGQVTLLVGLFSMLTSVIVGTSIGAIAGFKRGRIEGVLMRSTDVAMAIPDFFFILVVVTLFGSQPATLVLVIGAITWMPVSRVIYGEVLRWNARDFVLAAHAIGVAPWRILLIHVLPQAIPSLIVAATLGTAQAIIIESSISYLGLGIQPPLPSWGNMLQGAQTYIWIDPAIALYPGIAISSVVLALVLVGDRLRTRLDPLSRGASKA